MTMPSSVNRRWISAQRRCRTSPERPGSGTKVDKREKQGRVAKAFQGRRRCRLDHHIRVRTRDPKQEVDDPVGVGTIGDAHLDRHPQDLVLERPVHEIAGDELAIGNDHALVVAIDDRGGADVDAIDLAGAFPRQSPRRQCGSAVPEAG